MHDETVRRTERARAEEKGFIAAPFSRVVSWKGLLRPAPPAAILSREEHPLQLDPARGGALQAKGMAVSDESRSRGPENRGCAGGDTGLRFVQAARLHECTPLCFRPAGVGIAGLLYITDSIEDRLKARAQPEVAEQYRLLLLPAAVARGGRKGAAVAALLRRGYVPVPGAAELGVAPGVWSIDAVALDWLAVGLPRLGQRWSSIGRAALDIDAEALPQITVVPAHASLWFREVFRDRGARPRLRVVSQPASCRRALDTP